MSATRAGWEIPGWQAMNTSRSKSSSNPLDINVVVHGGVLGCESVEFGLALSVAFGAPDPVDRPSFDHSGHPRCRVGQDTVNGPLFQRRDKRVLGQVLRRCDIADQP